LSLSLTFWLPQGKLPILILNLFSDTTLHKSQEMTQPWMQEVTNLADQLFLKLILACMKTILQPLPETRSSIQDSERSPITELLIPS
jgi:hypothetical protein